MSKEETKANGKNGTANGKAANGQNGKTNGQKIIPSLVWKEFAEFWDSVEWKDLTEKDIKKHLGKYLFIAIPKNITDPKIGKAFFDEIKQFKEKGKGFGNYRINFAGQVAALESVFGNKPINPAEMTKTLHLYINDHHLSSSANVEPNGKNGKKTNIKVNTVDEMEKEVAKLKPKKGK